MRILTTVFCALLCQMAIGQPAPASDQRVDDSVSIPPRAAPTDYQSHTQAGSITIAAEFTGHSIALPQAVLSTEDYVVVEVGLFGAPGTNAKLSIEDFSLRINEKKAPSPAQPFALVFRSLKDPEWEPPGGSEKKSKGGGISSGGNGQSDPPPTPAKMPIELRRVMQQRVQKASLREGDRALPEAGLLFFQYGGQTKGIHAIELIYTGPAGKATLALQP
jgi:hypothetical protein